MNHQKAANIALVATIIYFISVVITNSLNCVIGGAISIIGLYTLWIGLYLMPKQPNIIVELKELQAQLNQLINKINEIERDVLGIQLSKK